MRDRLDGLENADIPPLVIFCVDKSADIQPESGAGA